MVSFHLTPTNSWFAIASVAALGGWGPLGEKTGRASAVTCLYFSFCPLIKSVYFKMYCQQIFPFVQLLYRFLVVALQSYFEALSFYTRKNITGYYRVVGSATM